MLPALFVALVPEIFSCIPIQIMTTTATRTCIEHFNLSEELLVYILCLVPEKGKVGYGSVVHGMGSVSKAWRRLMIERYG